VDGAALPTAAKDLGDCRLQTGVGVGVRELDADDLARTKPRRKEVSPEGLGLGLADVDAEDLAAAGFLDAVGSPTAGPAHAL
jgi:hypothetical protein